MSIIGTTTGIAADTSRLANKANLEKAGKQFEAVFVNMMLTSMRKAKLADPLFDSKAIDTFSEMQDQKVAATITEHTPLGIGKAMTDFLSRAMSTQATDAAPEETLNSPAANPSP